MAKAESFLLSANNPCLALRLTAAAPRRLHSLSAAPGALLDSCRGGRTAGSHCIVSAVAEKTAGAAGISRLRPRAFPRRLFYGMISEMRVAQLPRLPRVPPHCPNGDALYCA